jgi:hypothetical protein
MFVAFDFYINFDNSSYLKKLKILKIYFFKTLIFLIIQMIKVDVKVKCETFEDGGSISL